MTAKTRMIDLGWLLAKVEEVSEGGQRGAQLIIVQPNTEEDAADSITIADIQALRNLQEALYDFLVDFDTEPDEQEMKKGIDSNEQP